MAHTTFPNHFRTCRLPDIEMPGDEEAAEAEKLKRQEEMLTAYEDEKERRLDQLVQVEIEYLTFPSQPTISYIEFCTD